MVMIVTPGPLMRAGWQRPVLSQPPVLSKKPVLSENATVISENATVIACTTLSGWSTEREKNPTEMPSCSS